jgi:hypothetical protein
MRDGLFSKFTTITPPIEICMIENIKPLKLILLIALILINGALLHGQKFVASDSIELLNKDKLFSFSSSDAHYIVIKEGSKVRLIGYDTLFRRQFVTMHHLDDVLNSKILVGAASVDGTIIILLCNKWRAHFSILLYDPLSRKFRSGVNFDMDSYVYLNWFTQSHKLNIIAIKKRSSVISIVSMDSSGLTDKKTFDLSAEKFGNLVTLLLSDELVVSHYNYASVVENLTLKKISPGTYRSDLDPDDLCKMYYDDKEVIITLNTTTSAFTQVLQLNMISGAYTNYKIPYAKNSVVPGEVCDRSSFLVDHKLFTLFVCTNGLSIGIYDLDSNKYIKQWGPDFQSLSNIISSLLVYEKIENKATLNIYEITYGKKDTIESWANFQKKMLTMPILSISADKTAAGNFDVYVSGLTVIEKTPGTSMGGGLPMGFGGASFATGVGSFSMDPASCYEEDQPKVRKRYFFKCSLNGNNFEKTGESHESAIFAKFQMEYLSHINSGNQSNCTRFNLGNRFYLGFYMLDAGDYVIQEFK